MKTGLLVAFAAAAAADVGPWGQCGGIGYTGETTCQSGWHCQYVNDWYSQCLQGAASSATSTTIRSITTTASTPTSTGGVTCSGSFSKISASDFIKNLNPGWNLGNTLDAVPDEGSWNNPKVQAATFAQVKAAGFKGVRIPVTYAHHFDSESPSYTINSAWLDRVSAVIDMALDAGLYVLTNVHHDSWIWMDITKGADKNMIRQKFYATWFQVGKKLACKSSKVAFESINEPPANTESDAAFINELNEIFLRALADSGGFNTNRVVNLVGPSMDPTKTSQWFKPPATVVNPWALHFHYYGPYDFIFSAWGKTTWGSSSEAALMQSELGIVHGNFSNVPLVIGEFDASPINCEAAGRWKWSDKLTSTARDIGAAIIVWDNGLDHLDRNTGKWRDPTSIEIMKAGLQGQANSLPDATTDTSATQQESDAFVYHKLGAAVADYALSFSLNGNTLSSITTSSGTKLVSGTHYTVSGSTVTLKASFLSTYLSASTTGVKETLTFAFSRGASPRVQIVVWDVPVFSSTSSTAVRGSDLHVGVTFKGVAQPAAVKMVYSDGTYVTDDWTQWLGPLQQARGTYNGQWSWDDTGVILRSAVIDLVAAAGKSAVFTFEFYPRVDGNSVKYTLNV